MNKLDNYIFLTICEVSLKQFKKSRYMTFVNYCVGMGHAIKSANLGRTEHAALTEIGITLEKIYGLSDDEAGMYIADYFFFENEKIIQFEKAVRSTLEFYPMATSG
jgi:hypothetical protein